MLSLTTKLAALQQAEYEAPRFQQWIAQHQHNALDIAPKKWTPKLKLLRILTRLFTPLFGETKAILFALRLLEAPQFIIKSALIFAARCKLRWLQKKGLIVVSISGSYAKTSTKLILKHQLEHHIPLLATPESVNTPIGIARVILHQLSPAHKLFLAELGAYYPGDIAQLAKFVRPKYSILTPIGPEHLERFGSMQRVADSELEILHAGKQQKICSFHANCKWIPPHVRLSTYGKGGDLKITHSSTSRSGTEAEAKIEDTTVALFIPLYGKHNAENSLPGFWLAKQLHVSLEEIRKRSATIPAIPHRMEPTLTENQVLILDNGYNTSPHTAPKVLETLKEIPGSNKVVITPGYVELGEEQYRYNVALGEKIAETATAVGIIGSANRKALADGLANAGFPEKKIVFADNEHDATLQLQSFITPQSIVLYEGGTPEIYQ